MQIHRGFTRRAGWRLTTRRRHSRSRTDLDAVETEERRERYRTLGRNYVHLTPTGPYKFTILETRHGEFGTRVGFRENMDIKFLRPHEIAVNWDTGKGGLQAIANGSEAKIADAMLSTLRQQAVLADAGSDLRFSMRPGGRPGPARWVRLRSFVGMATAR